MVAQKKTSLYDSVIQITTDYLGPAAGRFIDRQIENHLQKQPQDLRKKDLDVLINWSKVAIALLTEDKAVVDEFSRRLAKLGKKGTT